VLLTLKAKEKPPFLGVFSAACIQVFTPAASRSHLLYTGFAKINASTQIPDWNSC
jgi:hypothetical protein